MTNEEYEAACITAARCYDRFEGEHKLKQIATLEAALAKVADKEGQIAVANFEPNPEKRIVHVKGHWRTVQTAEGPRRKYIEEYSYERDYAGQVREELSRAGISETDDLIDPVSGKIIKDVQVGKQYTLKLVHQAEKKTHPAWCLKYDPLQT